MDAEREQKLRAVQDMAIDNAVEEMEAAHEKSLQTKGDRGDRGWLTGMAAKSMGVAVRIEQFLMLRSRGAIYTGDDAEAEAAAVDSMIRSARAEVGRIMENAKAGAQPPRKKRASASD